jgi:hypothetical protein
MNRKGIGIFFIIIVIVLVLVSGFWCYKTYKNRSSKQVPILSLNNVPSDWKTCQNTKLGFSLRYPSDWTIVVPSRGNASPNGEPALSPTVTSCNDEIINDYGEIYLGPTTPTSSGEFDIDVCDLDCMNTSIYEGVVTLDQYLSRNPSELDGSNNPVVSKGVVDGEESATLKDGTIFVFHNGQEYEMSGTSSILATFTFLH